MVIRKDLNLLEEPMTRGFFLTPRSEELIKSLCHHLCITDSELQLARGKWFLKRLVFPEGLYSLLSSGGNKESQFIIPGGLGY